jgi:arylsulfatase A-like enzyme
MKKLNWFFIFCVILSLVSCETQKSIDQPPNVILIISDQWSTKVSDGSGNYDNGILTPGIDLLAKQGISFKQAYSTYPLCTPARASLFTGLYSHHNDVGFNLKKDSILARAQFTPTLGKSFKEAGYNVAYFGKEHAGGYGYASATEFGSMTHSNGGMLAEGSAYDPIFTEDAIKYIKDKKDKPFFMTLSLINPHDICRVLGGKVQGATFADAIHFARNDDEPYLRFQPRPDLPNNHEVAYEKGMILHEDFMYKEVFGLNEDQWKRFISTYQLLIENTDRLIGLLLKNLKEQGLEENTIVMFTTDHGEMAGSHKLIAKTTFYEESSKIPVIIRYPKEIKQSTTNNNALVSTIDIMPTLLDLAGVGIPKGIDGKSFKKQILESGVSTNEFDIVFSQNQFGRMVRYDEFKYVRSVVYGITYEILYDIDKDPTESKNLLEDPKFKNQLIKGRKLLDDWLVNEGTELIAER